MNINKKILSIAFLVRSKVGEWVQDNAECDPEDLTGACAIASYTLYRVLRSSGYDAKISSAVSPLEGHCWVELDNKIIDLTATQYDKLIEKIYIVDKNFYYKNEIPRFFRNENSIKFQIKIKNHLDTIKFIKTWHDQSPQIYLSKINSLIKNI